MSSRRLCVRISNCSRLFLSTWAERLTVKRSMPVGSGMGPLTCAPVRLAVLTISRVELSRIRWSKAFSLMRKFWLCILRSFDPVRVLLDNLGDDAGADSAAAFVDGEAE